MSLLSLEHSPAAHRADVALYVLASAALALALPLLLPPGQGLQAVAWVVAGLAGWSVLEYGLHRFVLHGVAPFSRWHRQHHLRPKALIGLPTVMSGGLLLGLVALPALALLPPWRALALLLGVVLGYLSYSVTHHRVHHIVPRSAWGRQRRRSHALHHAHPDAGGYGVSTGFWDHVFGTPARRVP